MVRSVCSLLAWPPLSVCKTVWKQGACGTVVKKFYDKIYLGIFSWCQRMQVFIVFWYIILMSYLQVSWFRICVLSSRVLPLCNQTQTHTCMYISSPGHDSWFLWCNVSAHRAIKRIIFYSLMKPHLTETGEKEMDVISTSQALQIAGRAGRYNTAYQDGEVTTFRSDDLNLLKDVVSRPIDPIEVGDHCVMPWCLYTPSLCLQRLCC